MLKSLTLAAAVLSASVGMSTTASAGEQAPIQMAAGGGCLAGWNVHSQSLGQLVCRTMAPKAAAASYAAMAKQQGCRGGYWNAGPNVAVVPQGTNLSMVLYTCAYNVL